MNAALAPSYVHVTERPGQPASRLQLEMLQARYAWAAEQARGKDVLEAGCGAGMGLPVLAEAARSVQAGDVDPENLRAARAACAGHAQDRAAAISRPGASVSRKILRPGLAVRSHLLPSRRPAIL